MAKFEHESSKKGRYVAHGISCIETGVRFTLTDLVVERKELKVVARSQFPKKMNFKSLCGKKQKLS